MISNPVDCYVLTILYIDCYVLII